MGVESADGPLVFILKLLITAGKNKAITSLETVIKLIHTTAHNVKFHLLGHTRLYREFLVKRE